MVLNDQSGPYNAAAKKLAGRQLKKKLLLVLEVLAVAGLLLAAIELWQVQQTLQQDLTTAQEIEAIMQDGENNASVEEAGESGLKLWSPYHDDSGSAGARNGESLAPESWWGTARIGGGNDD